jgi:hypothetical protein
MSSTSTVAGRFERVVGGPVPETSAWVVTSRRGRGTTEIVGAAPGRPGFAVVRVPAPRWPQPTDWSPCGRLGA